MITVGETLTATEWPLHLCKYGLHASAHVFDALRYAPGPILCRVELGGEILRAPDKVCAERRTVLEMRDVSDDLHRFAIWCARRALDRVDEPDPRSVGALDVKERWLEGQASDHELRGGAAGGYAAYVAASAAASADAADAAASASAADADYADYAASVAYVACVAADAAAAKAAVGADYSAERAAAKAAAKAAERKAQRRELARRINKTFLQGERQ